MRTDAEQVILDKQEFLAKRLSVNDIIGRLIKKTLRDLVRNNQMRESGRLSYDDLEYIPAVL